MRCGAFTIHHVFHGMREVTWLVFLEFILPTDLDRSADRF